MRERRGVAAKLLVEGRQQFRRRLLRLGWLVLVSLGHNGPRTTD
jgi:hypothetical protein